MTEGISGNTKKFHKWKAGQINIQSCSDDQKLHSALQECVRASLEVVCFQEVRLLNSGSVKHLGYSFYWNGMRRLKRYGVGIAIKNSPEIIVNGIINSTARLMAADVTVKGCRVRIISCYAPTLKTPLSTKQKFYCELSKLSKVDNHRKLLIMGDFNAEPLFCRNHSRFDGRKQIPENETNMSNENVMLFVNYCQRNQLAILNTWFDHPIVHRVTWHHPNGSTKKVYDYILSGSWLRQYVTDVRVRNSYFCSDHRLVVAKFKTPANKAARRFLRKPKVIKPDLNLLKVSDIKNNLVTAIHSHLENNPCTSSSTTEDIHNSIISALSKGRDQIPKISKNKRAVIPWSQDQELNELNKTRTELRQKYPTTEIQMKLKDVRKKIKSRVRKLQNDELKEKAQNINMVRQTRKMAKLWRNAKKHDSSSFTKASPIQCAGISTHFKHHFNPDQSSMANPTELDSTPDYIKILQNSTIEIINDPPTVDEIQSAIHQLNKGKSSLDIESEIIQVASSIPLVKDHLHLYYKQIWTTKQIPNQWSISKIIPIWKKKGSAADPSKYRGISISSTLCKIGMNIILKRLSSFYESQLKRTQFGFRDGTGCNDGIYVVKQLQEIASSSQRKLFACFIDLTAAFDHINRKLLFQSILNRLPSNQENTNINILQELYKSTKSYLQHDNPDDDSFDTTAGVRQGGTEGPPLFNFFFDYVLRVYEDHKSDSGITGLSIPYRIPNEATSRAQKDHAPASGICDDDECGYADDLGLFCWTKEDLQTCMNIINQVFKDFGLTINLTKTETLVFNWQITPEIPYPESIITLNQKRITNSTAFKYLGT